jgi:hypothetical protein
VGSACWLAFGFAVLSFIQAEQGRPLDSAAIVSAEQAQRLHQIHDQEQTDHI